jgi:hypothetical protein
LSKIYVSFIKYIKIAPVVYYRAACWYYLCPGTLSSSPAAIYIFFQPAGGISGYLFNTRSLPENVFIPEKLQCTAGRLIKVSRYINSRLQNSLTCFLLNAYKI